MVDFVMCEFTSKKKFLGFGTKTAIGSIGLLLIRVGSAPGPGRNPEENNAFLVFVGLGFI